MLESLARLLFDLIQPSVQLMLLLAVAVALLAVGWRAWGLRVLAVWVVLFLVYASPFLSGTLVDHLEGAHPVLTDEHIGTIREAGDNPVFIIVLGSGHVPDPRLEPSQMLTEGVVVRLIEGLRVHRKLPGSRLVTSARVRHGTYSQAEAVRDAAIALGVDPEAIHIQPEPASTCEEARAFVRDHGPGTRVVIATSATHMRRAMMLFERQGARPVAAPAFFIGKRNPDKPFGLSDLLPSLEHIDELETAIKEYVGYLWDRRSCRAYVK